MDKGEIARLEWATIDHFWSNHTDRVYAVLTNGEIVLLPQLRDTTAEQVELWLPHSLRRAKQGAP